MKLGSKTVAAVLVLAGILIFTMAGVALAAPPWSDAPSQWWVDNYGVTEAQVGAVADGFPDGSFRPGDTVTRGQFAKMAVNGLDVEILNPVKPTFLDVPTNHIFFVHVEGAYAEGLIAGYTVSGGREFRPGNSIQRQQANSILGRYLSGLELDVTGVIRAKDGFMFESLELWYQVWGGYYLNGFEDSSQVVADHRANTAYLIYQGVVAGSKDGYLSPTATLNRAQAAAMVLRVAGKAAELTTSPPAPTDLTVTPPSPSRDTTPRVTGKALPNGRVTVYDTFAGATVKLTEVTANEAGNFYADLTVPLVDGTHQFTAKVKNVLGVVSPASAPVEYVLDTVPPSGIITAPSVPSAQPDAAVSTPKPDFTATAADDRSGVKNVQFQFAVEQATPAWQTISIGEEPNTGTTIYPATWPTEGAPAAGLVDGQYLFRVIITDKAGNTTTSDAVPVTVDTKPPTATIAGGTLEPVADDGTFYTKNNKPSFGVIGLDTPAGENGTAILPSGVVKVEFLRAPNTPTPSVWADFVLISSDLGTSGFAVYPDVGVPDGDYRFAVRTTDRAGNQSLLKSGDPATFVEGVTRRVVIDTTPPVVSITAPAEGELVPDDTDYTIKWTLTDLTPPNKVKIEYSDDGGDTWEPIDGDAGEVPFAPGQPGTYLWRVPNITGADVTTYKIRITAIDGLGNTTVATSGVFTIYDAPTVPTDLIGSDPDGVEDGVDWRDFRAEWALSVSPHIVLQQVFLIRDGQALDLASPTPDQPVAFWADNTTDTWISTEELVKDSKGEDLVAGQYRVFVVVVDAAGRKAIAESDAFTVKAP